MRQPPYGCCSTGNVKHSIMLSAEEKKRYIRQFIPGTFGPAEQFKLKEAKVLVIGAGGLGCPALLYLAAAGTGTIGIVDDDKVSLSNLPRQILYTAEDIGKYKVQQAKDRLQSTNSECNINIYNERLTTGNVMDLVSAYGVVIDGSDNMETRYILDDACTILKKPLVYGAISRFEGQVSVFNYNDGPSYRNLFPEPKISEHIPSCNEAGVLGVLPGIIGIYQATEAIKIVTDIGEVLSGKLLIFNLLKNQAEYFNFTGNLTHLGKLSGYTK